MGLISPLYRLLNRPTAEHCTIFPPVARPREDVLTFVSPRCIIRNCCIIARYKKRASGRGLLCFAARILRMRNTSPTHIRCRIKRRPCGKKVCAGAPGTREKETKRKDLQLIFYQDSTPFNMACISSLASILSREYYCIMQCIFVQKNLRWIVRSSVHATTLCIIARMYNYCSNYHCFCTS